MISRFYLDTTQQMISFLYWNFLFTENFDEFFETYLEDCDFFMRCDLSKLKAKYVNNAIIVHKNKKDSIDYSKRYFFEIRNTIYGIKKLKGLAKKTRSLFPKNRPTTAPAARPTMAATSRYLSSSKWSPRLIVFTSSVFGSESIVILGKRSKDLLYEVQF